MKSIFIIADIGSGFRGSLEHAFKQIESAKRAGADAAKFQLYSHSELYGYSGEIAGALSREWLPQLKYCCDENKIEFMCTPFSVSGFVALDSFVKRHKIASSDFKDWQLWEAMVGSKKPIIASTGAAHAIEVERMVYKYANQSDLTLLECVASYPAAIGDYRLSAIASWRSRFPHIGRGISDHTTTNDLALLSTELGIDVIEHHFDGLDSLGKTPDSCVSFSEMQMKDYCAQIRKRRILTHDEIKRPWGSEDPMQLLYRKRIVANLNIKRGERLSLNDNFGFFRVKVPDHRGAPPEMWKDFDGKLANKNIEPGTPLWLDDIM